ncbi:MAG: HAD family phosphatase [Thiovulaceae bacterium]|nr:HAD family phosphatase [Sulfurimonadaceae bacterium]
MKKHILFDNDGVLVETERYYFLATQKALADHGVVLTLDYYQTIMPKAITAWHLMLDAGFSNEDVLKTRTQRNLYYQEYLKSQPLYIQGVEEVIKELSKSYSMAIITTSRRDDFEIIHEDQRLTKYMEFVLCEEDYPRAKPYPDPYLKGIELLGAPKHETLIVEDSERGLTSAVNAQIECAIVYNEFTTSHDFSQAHYRIQNLQELHKLLG